MLSRFLKGKTISEEHLRHFYSGVMYPISLMTLVFIGYISGIELLTFALTVLLTSVGILSCDSLRPLIAFACSFLYQISTSHSPGFQAGFSNYYFTGWRVVVIVLTFMVLGTAIAVFFLRSKAYMLLLNKKTLLSLLPMGVLSLAFVLNGAFSSSWSFADVMFGVCQTFIYLGIYLLFYLGLKNESVEELVEHFVLVSATVAVLLFAEVGWVYIVNGAIVPKEQVVFGWGIWNTAGVCLSVLIPVCFIGVFKYSRRGWLYLAAATVAFLGALLTQSRNAWLFGTVAYCGCIIAAGFIGKYKRIYRIISLTGILGAIVCIAVLGDKLGGMLAAFINDNGRYTLWSLGIESFLASPLFGSGFYSFSSETFISSTFLPDMAHQIFVTLLSATGIFGILAYLFYRLWTVLHLRRPTVVKAMLFASMSVLLLESMLDNFVFYFLPLLHYGIALVLLRLCHEDSSVQENLTLEKEI